MSMPLNLSESNEDLTVYRYKSKLDYMSDQLRITEQRLSTKIDQEINQAYHAQQNAISTNMSFMKKLKNFDGQ